MTDELLCPSCGTDDHLSGRREGDVIRITCEACDLVWDRDPSPRCPTCGSRDVHPAPQTVLEKSRGTQLSIVALRVVHLCVTCDADVLQQQRESNRAIPPRENPVGDEG